MKKFFFLLLLGSYSIHSFAADQLNGTVWRTIDDETNQAKAIVKFSEDQTGALSATIKKILVPSEANACLKSVFLHLVEVKRGIGSTNKKRLSFFYFGLN